MSEMSDSFDTDNSNDRCKDKDAECLISENIQRKKNKRIQQKKIRHKQYKLIFIILNHKELQKEKKKK